MAPHILVPTRDFARAYLDLPLILEEAQLEETVFLGRLEAVLNTLQSGDFNPLQIFQSPSGANRKCCEIMAKVYLEFEFDKDTDGPGKPIRWKVRLLAFRTGC